MGNGRIGVVCGRIRMGNWENKNGKWENGMRSEGKGFGSGGK